MRVAHATRVTRMQPADCSDRASEPPAALLHPRHATDPDSSPASARRMSSEAGHTGARIRLAHWARDRDALLSVRVPVFVDEQHVPAEIEEDDLDPVCIHALAEDERGLPIGTARLDAHGHIGRVAVAAAWRRRGVGGALMAFLTGIARHRGDPRIELGAQVQAIPFYEALGYVASGPVYLEAGIEHRLMHLDLSGD